MRRFIAHVSLAATALLMVGATFSSIFTKVGSNMEFSEGKQFVYRVAEKNEDGSANQTVEFTDDNAVKEIAKEMESRLQKAEVSRYQIDVQGYDTIKVTLQQDTDTQYRNIQNYLSFNATLAISNSKETYALATEFLNPNEKAYVDDTNGYPAVVIPINSDNELYQAVYTEAKEMSDDGSGEVHVPAEEEGGEETHKAYMYLWYDYVEDYCSYSKTDSSSPDYDQNVASKILMTFDAANPYLNEDEDALRAYLQVGNSEDGSFTPTELATAFDNARFYVNLLNAGELNYHVSFLFSDTAKVAIENLVDLGTHVTVAWSRTFIATLCATFITILLLVTFYRLGAISVGSVSLVSVFAGICFIILFASEFNVAGIVGLIALAIASLSSGVVYLTKLKEECYRGRSLKKANTEAFKKAALPMVDIHVALIIIGVFSYILGGVYMKTFALVSILGGLVSLLLNLFALRGMMWLATNETAFANRYDLFGMDNKNVPDLMKEEKQHYYGSYADKDLTKKKKPLSIVAGCLFVLLTGAMVAFSVIDGQQIYNNGSNTVASEVYVEYTSDTNDNTALSSNTKEKIDTLLDSTLITYKNEEKKLNVYVEEIKSYPFTARVESSNGTTKTVYYAYYVVSFKNAFEGNENINYQGSNTFTATLDDLFVMDTLNDAGKANLSFNKNVSVSLKKGNSINNYQPDVLKVCLACLVGLAVSAVYLLLRYRLSRGLAMLVLGIVSGAIVAGIFSATRLAVTSSIILALPLVIFFTLTCGIILFNRERELVLDDKAKDNSVENRDNIMVKATSISFSGILSVFILSIILAFSFFGFGPDSISWIFLGTAIGFVISLGLVVICGGYVAQLFFRLFKNVNVQRPHKVKKNKKAVRVNKSAEPEEAIFIGIND